MRGAARNIRRERCWRLVVVGVIVSSFAAYPQRLNSVTGIPDYVLYASFFDRVMWLEKLADRLAAEGKNDAKVRTTIMKEANLSVAEASEVKAIASEWSKENRNILAALKSMGGGVTERGPELTALQAQRKQNVQSKIQVLRSRLAPSSFFCSIFISGEHRL